LERTAPRPGSAPGRGTGVVAADPMQRWFWRLWHILFHESPRGHCCRGVPEVMVHKSAKNDDEIAVWQEGICATIIRERDDVRAENADLLAQANRTAGIYEKEIDMLRADVKRLRTALEKIEAGYGQRLSAAELASIARQAL